MSDAVTDLTVAMIYGLVPGATPVGPLEPFLKWTIQKG